MKRTTLLKRPSAKLIAAAVAAIAAGGGAAGGALALTEREDTSPATAAALVADGRRAVEQVAGALTRADSLKGLRTAGDIAAERARFVRGLTARGERALTADPALAQRVEGVLTADVAALQSVAQLRELTPDTLARWQPMLADIRRAAADVSVYQRSLAASRRPAPALATAVTGADALVDRARRRLAGWRRRHFKAMRERRRELAVLGGYQSTMLAYLRDYDELRTEMSSWIAKVDGGGVTFDEGYEFLAQASADRARVRRGIAALDAPAALAAEHSALMTVLDAGIAAVDMAYDGTIDFEFDLAGEYDSYRDTPGWSTFTSQSQEVTGRYAGARADWERTFTQERQQIRDRAMPKVPDV